MSPPIVWGSEQLVNTATDSDQAAAKVAALEGGGFVVVWRDDSDGGFNAGNIKAQVYAADGTPSGGEIVVATYTAYTEHTPDVAGLPGGGFVVVWSGADHPDSGGYWSISAQMFDAAGAKVGEETLVDVGGDTDYCTNPSVAALDSGGFVVAWEQSTETAGGLYDSSIMVRRVGSDGSVLDEPVKVNIEDTGAQVDPKVTALGDGTFAVVWVDDSASTGDISGSGINARIFEDDGQAVTDPFLVNTGTTDTQSEVTVAGFGDGTFAVVWRDTGSSVVPGSGSAIIGQIVDSAGNLLGDDFVIRDGLGGTTPSAPAVAAVAGGLVTVVTETTPDDPSGSGIVATGTTLDAFYAATADGTPLTVNATVTDDQVAPAIVRLADGRLAVVYVDESASADDPSGSAVRLRIIDSRGGAITGTDRGEAIYGSVQGGAIVNDTIDGKGGDDVIRGLDGDDTIDGGTGKDAMHGGSGDDTYLVDNADDQAIEDSDTGGTDLVKASVSFTLGAFVEKLTLTGAGHIDGTGNGLANVITGNSGDNLLDGKGGDDELAGGKGDDVYVVDAAGDTVIEKDGNGTDRVESAVSFQLTEFIENLTLTGNGAVDATGNGAGNEIKGNGAANRIDGKGGADAMAGAGGGDTYVVDDAGDTVTELDGGGTDLVESAVAFALGAFVENLVLTGTGAVGGTGNGLANRITGNDAANALSGLAGNDRLAGGLGKDMLTGGGGRDSFVFDTLAAPTNVDRIEDFSHRDDAILLDRSAGYAAIGAKLTASEFVVGAKARDASDRIVWNPKSGVLLFDQNGSKAGGAVKIAILDKGLALDHTDFLMI